MLLEHERDYGLGMDVMVTLCSWRGARRRLWFGHGCNGNPLLLEGSTKEIMVWAWMQREPYALGGEHEGDFGLGMDVKVTVCSWNTKEIMVLYPPIPAAKICSTTRPLTGAVSKPNPKP